MVIEVIAAASRLENRLLKVMITHLIDELSLVYIREGQRVKCEY